jgi:hypothetical protein
MSKERAPAYKLVPALARGVSALEVTGAHSDIMQTVGLLIEMLHGPRRVESNCLLLVSRTVSCYEWSISEMVLRSESDETPDRPNQGGSSDLTSDQPSPPQVP